MSAASHSVLSKLFALTRSGNFHRTLNSALRISTLATKGGLIFFLAAVLRTEEVGLYGLISGIVTYLVFFYGFDFYAYSSRLYIGGTAAEALSALKNQTAVTFIFYIIFAPIGYVALLRHAPSPHIAILAIAISLLEHLSMEAQRAYVFTLRPLYSSLILFMRAGLWPVVCVGIFLIDRYAQSLEFVLILWILGLISAMGVAIYPVRRYAIEFIKTPIDFGWIGRGVLIAAPLLVGTIALRGLFSLDRVLVAGTHRTDLLAAYVLYAGISSAIQAVADAGVVVYKQPIIVAAARRYDYAGIRTASRQMAVESVILSSILGFCAFIVFLFGAHYLQKHEYTRYASVLALVLVAGVIYVAGLTPHAVLFAFKRDRENIAINLAGFATFFGVFFLVAGSDETHAVGWALVGGFAVIAGVKQMLAQRLISSVAAR